MEINDLVTSIQEFFVSVESMPVKDRVQFINQCREAIHEHSPFKNEPVDFVRWVFNESVIANDYNPNKVAPPEMQLLEVSILADGYTQPIVGYIADGNADKVEVVDGFHRNRVGRESIVVKNRVHGYLPVVAIRGDQQGKDARMASTIRHNRARGKHQVSAMSEIVMELKNRNWANARIARELGMDEDEILRLCQISGLETLFSDKDFSKAWVSDGFDIESGEFTDEVSDEDMGLVRIPNEGDSTRIFHSYDKWEAVEYGFFNSTHPTLTPEQCKYKYKVLLGDIIEFDRIIELIFKEWPNSCEHNLTNRSLNRIAWLGQAAVSYKYRVPSVFSSGWEMLSEKEKAQANLVAFKALNRWLKSKGIPEISLEDALQVERQVELY